MWTRTVEADLKPANIGLSPPGAERRTGLLGVDSSAQPCPSLRFAPDDDDDNWCLRLMY